MYVCYLRKSMFPFSMDVPTTCNHWKDCTHFHHQSEPRFPSSLVILLFYLGAGDGFRSLCSLCADGFCRGSRSPGEPASNPMTPRLRQSFPQVGWVQSDQKVMKNKVPKMGTLASHGTFGLNKQGDGVLNVNNGAGPESGVATSPICQCSTSPFPVIQWFFS